MFPHIDVLALHTWMGTLALGGVCYRSHLEGFSLWVSRSQFVFICLIGLCFLDCVYSFSYLFIYLFIIYYSSLLFIIQLFYYTRDMLVYGYGMAEYGPKAIPE